MSDSSEKGCARLIVLVIWIVVLAVTGVIASTAINWIVPLMFTNHETWFRPIEWYQAAAAVFLFGTVFRLAK